MNIVHVPYMGNSNPYQHLLFSALEKRGVHVFQDFNPDADIIHLHWINPLCVYKKLLPSIRDFFILRNKLIRHKRNGGKIFWTVHNSISHDSRHILFEKHVRKYLLNLIDVAIVHGPTGEKILKNIYGDFTSCVSVVTHPNYIDYYPNEITTQQARMSLGINACDFVFLFLGEIRPYKGVLEFIDVFSDSFQSQQNVSLVIAGRLADKRFEKKINNAILNPNIRLETGFVPDDKIQLYMNSADLVVFPFRQILSSGSIILAMSYAKPCLVPKIGCVPDVLDERGGFLYSKNENLRNIVLNCYKNKERLKQMGLHNYEKVKKWNWDDMAEKLVNMYHASVARE